MVQLALDRMSTRMVGPYEYTHTVRTVRVRSKYAYGLEHICVLPVCYSNDKGRACKGLFGYFILLKSTFFVKYFFNGVI